MNARVVLVVLVALAGCGERGAPLPPPPPRPAAAAADEEAVEVKASRPRRETACVGELKARRTTRLGAQVSGRVAEVLVEEGAVVKEKQELVKLDAATFELEADVKEREMESAIVARTDAEVQFARLKAMWEKPAGEEPSIPRKQYDDAKARLDAAIANVRLAEAALKVSRQKLADAVIRAPFDGVVTRRFVDPGQPVTSAPVTDLVEVRDVAELDLEYVLPQAMLARVDEKTPVAWEIDGAAPGESAVGKILPDVDEATRTFRCRTSVKNADGKLRPGLLARVRVIETAPRDALYVPATAIVPSAAGPTVRILDGGKPAVRPVRTGAAWGDFVEITEGLAAGDRLLVPKPE
ncbi:MAG: efflux RND transporter periplasmic adaptor subunit [Planctomycetia bacterium]|nr:efflux RND transporter periplasmic adaptor subunit [Planctomycetia bacterium]